MAGRLLLAWVLVLVAVSAGTFYIGKDGAPPPNDISNSIGTSSGSRTPAPIAAPAPTEPSGPIVDRMTDRPAKFIGSTVSIEGNVHTVPATRVFSIVEPGSRNPLLVIAMQSPPPLRPDDEIQARGKVVKLDDPAALQRQYGVDLAPERVGNWQGKPVLIADQVRLQHSARSR